MSMPAKRPRISYLILRRSCADSLLYPVNKMRGASAFLALMSSLGAFAQRSPSPPPPPFPPPFPPLSAGGTACQSWCNAKTCAEANCGECPVCIAVTAGQHCAEWCNAHTCDDDHCANCAVCGGTITTIPRPTGTIPRPTGGSTGGGAGGGTGGTPTCANWCNAHTCGQTECAACQVCTDLDNGDHCESWCNAHTCDDDHCANCAVCGGTITTIPRPTPTTIIPASCRRARARGLQATAGCENWCNAHTCDQCECSTCQVCTDLDNGDHCESWCNAHTCDDDHCANCAVCGGAITTSTHVAYQSPSPPPFPPGQCVSWCNAHTCDEDACSSCDVCSGVTTETHCAAWCNGAHARSPSPRPR